MTTTIERLIDQLRRSAEGDAWHGPSVREVLEGVTVDDASSHPISGAHSIRELVLHMAAGIQLVLRRVDGDGRQLSPEEDWPTPSEPTEEAWQRDVESLFALNQRLREAVATFPATHLDDPLVPDPPYSAFTQFIGLTQHDLYHAGQIVLLRRALGHPR
jgi:uncharacterized damage-inducible protein DinB